MKLILICEPAILARPSRYLLLSKEDMRHSTSWQHILSNELLSLDIYVWRGFRSTIFLPPLYLSFNRYL